MKYIVPLAKSMTGVPVMPTVAALLLHPPGSWATATGTPKFFCRRMAPVTLSMARMSLLAVAT